MPRPRKWRKVCCMPVNRRFGPLDQQDVHQGIVEMTVDEYETIRLIDYQGMNQEECADQMSIARTTVQRIYNDARRKLADLIVGGSILTIEGGDFELYGGVKPCCCTEKGKRKCHSCEQTIVKYRCEVCGYVLKGELPQVYHCPVCRQPASVFKKLEEEETV